MTDTPRAENRFDIREEEDGSWTVFDIFTGLAAEVHGVPQFGLDIQDADELRDLLNLQDLRRRGKSEI